MTRAGPRRRVAAALGTIVLLGACAGAPVESVVESLDERTAVTVTALPEPLLFTSALGTPTSPDDVALGPFEINRMGQKSWYLWVNRLGGTRESATLARLRIVADGVPVVELQPLAGDVQLPLSAPPYRPLADWAAQAYYAITPEELAQLQGRARLAVELPSARDGSWVRFDLWQGRAAALDQFVERQLAGRVAGR